MLLIVEIKKIEKFVFKDILIYSKVINNQYLFFEIDNQ